MRELVFNLMFETLLTKMEDRMLGDDPVGEIHKVEQDKVML